MFPAKCRQLAGRLETPAFPEVYKHWGDTFHSEQDYANCSASGTNCCLVTWAAEEQREKAAIRKRNRLLALQAGERAETMGGCVALGSHGGEQHSLLVSILESRVL